MSRTLQTNTYTYLYACANWAREQPIPRQFPGYALYRRMVHLTFLALTYEAFLNHCGYLKFPWWRSAERTMSTEAKLAIVLDLSEVSFESGKPPMQSLATLMKLRNDMAHGKTTSVPLVDSMIFDPTLHAPRWLKILKRSGEDQLHEDVVAFVTQVYNALGFNADHPTPFGLMAVPKDAP